MHNVNVLTENPITGTLSSPLTVITPNTLSARSSNEVN